MIKKRIEMILLFLFLCFIDRASAERSWSPDPPICVGSSLAACVAQIGSTPQTLVVSSPISYGSTVTVPSTMILQFLGNGSIDCNSQASAVTINGAVAASDTQQIFVNCPAGSVVGLKYATPKWFGAKGDNSTDDTIAYRSVFQNVAVGGEIFFPPGTYLLDPHTNAVSLQIIKDQQRIRAAPGTVTIKMKDGALRSGNCGTLLGDGSGAKTSITIDGLIFDGNARGTSGTLSACYDATSFSPIALLFSFLDGVTFVNSKIIDTAYSGFVTSNCNNVYIANNIFSRVGQGYCTETTDKPCDDNTDCSGTCRKLSGDPVQVNAGFNIQVVQNQFLDTAEGPYLQHESGTGRILKSGRIAGNIIKIHTANEMCLGSGNPYACCSGYQAGTGAFGTAGSSLCAPGDAQGTGIGVIGEDVVVADNIMVRHQRLNISGNSSQSTQATKKIVVTGNLFATVGAGNTSAAINISNNSASVTVDDIQILGNTIDGAEHSGLRIAPTGNSTISTVHSEGNRFIATCSVQTTCAGIFFDTASGSDVISKFTSRNDAILNSTRYGVWIDSGTYSKNAFLGTIFDGNLGITNFVSGGAGLWVEPHDLSNAMNGLTQTQWNTLVTNGLSDGSYGICSNCNSSCASGGTGLMWKRLNGANVCN